MRDAYQYRVTPRRSGYGARALSAVLTAACLGFAGLMLLPALLGYERYVITSGSMTGSYDRGSIVYAKTVPVETLRPGDVITYVPPPAAGPDGLVTHRIFSIERDAAGRPVFRTKGDANATPDPWTFVLDQGEQARVAYSLPYVGYAFAALGDRLLRTLLIGLPALLIGLSVAVKLLRAPAPAGREQAEEGRA